MIKIIRKIRHWFWWNFKATENDKTNDDMMTYGTGFMKDGKRINPKDFYIN